LTVTSDRADDGVLLAAEAVHGALSIALGARSIVLCLASRVLLRAGLLPRLEAGDIADLQ
jgi:hypothetical protein